MSRRDKMGFVSKAKRLFGDSASGIVRSGYLNSDGNQTSSRTSFGSTNSDVTDDPEDAHWSLDACLDILESVNTSGMTPEQKAALRNLRSASNLIKSQGPRRARRDAKIFSFGRRKSSIGAEARPSPLMTRELLKCFHEVEDNKEDTDQQSNTTAVLATYGGEIFDGVFGFAPSLESTQRATGPFNPTVNVVQAPKAAAASMPISSSNPMPGAGDEPNRRGSERRFGAVNIEAMEISGSFVQYLIEPDQCSDRKVYCPPEWNALTIQARKELSVLLSWENISQWDFDVLVVADLSRETMNNADDEVEEKKRQFCPLLFVGWAILCAPLAQQAMEGSLGNVSSCDPCGNSSANTTAINSHPYDFCGELKIDPDTVCNFLRQVEQGYHFENPYHNNIHAADVTQTLHCLLQLMEPDYADKIFTSFDFFTVLLAATFHDIGHPGTNNLFEMNARTALAVKYNDNSVLESMHSAVGHSLLLGEEKNEEWDVFKHWDNEQIGRARAIMIKAILATDMSTHFPSVGVLASLVEKVQVEYVEDDTEEEEETNKRHTPLYILSQILAVRETNKEKNPLKEKCRELANLILKFLLHAADISNPAKKNKLLVYWADKALAEFFDQGDREVELGIPISPLCDRRTVKRADSQIGFLKFVIRPTYALLGEILPRVKEEVIPIVDQNINYWTREKSRISLMTLTQHPVMRKATMRASDFKKEDSDIGEEEEEEEEHVVNESHQ
mmetsp:Transcript_15692/g.33157  ORF Transcript_15692/g.33157 Transcript_15692/m.33157 type:complete len:730 (+) Transcript_15692:122-2311(+)